MKAGNLASFTGPRLCRVSRRVNEPANIRMAKDMLYLHLRLIPSARGQKAEAKPGGSSPRERRQGRAVMGGREVASLPGEMGLPLGQGRERASDTGAKFDLSAYNETGRAVADAVSSAPPALVRPAITSRTRFVHFTDEVPRRLIPPGSVSPGYKSPTKGPGDASETGTVFPRPRLQGCQQRQSRGVRRGRFPGPGACSERQNLRVPPGPLRSMRPVSPAIAATTGPDGTSSCQPAGSLSNSPLQPETGQAAVRPR